MGIYSQHVLYTASLSVSSPSSLVRVKLQMFYKTYYLTIFYFFLQAMVEMPWKQYTVDDHITQTFSIKTEDSNITF